MMRGNQWAAGMRAMIAAALVVAPAVACAQAATVETPTARGPTGWTEQGEAARLERAGVTAPGAVGAWQRWRTMENSGIGVDAAANYRRGQEQMTLFLYQPINGEADIHWVGVARGMLEQLRAPPGYPAPQGIVDTAHGKIAWETVTSGAGANILTDVVALGRTSGGWYVKVRVSASTDGPAAVEAARALVSALTLPAGQTIAAPSLAPIPDCAARSVPGDPKVVNVRKFDDRLTATIVAVLPLAGVGGPADATPRCRLGERPIGPSSGVLYRSVSPGNPVNYVAAFGSGGATISLVPVMEEKGLPVWWLMLDLFKERIVLQQWRGPVDDADFIRASGAIEQIMRGPIVTQVGRN